MQYNGGLDSPSAWYIIPATTIEVTITEAGYATINYPFAVTLPDELTAYTGTPEGSHFILQEILSKTIPANSPVILAGKATTYTLAINAENSEKPLETGLQGTNLYTNIPLDANTYVLANGTNQVGFYLLSNDESARTLAANKAYLETNSSSNIKAFTFDLDGGTTGIESSEATVETAEEYYDLQGRRVANPTKGIYVTKSGKKVLFTK